MSTEHQAEWNEIVSDYLKKLNNLILKKLKNEIQNCVTNHQVTAIG